MCIARTGELDKAVVIHFYAKSTLSPVNNLRDCGDHVLFIAGSPEGENPNVSVS
jgi:hypothetical protein